MTYRILCRDTDPQWKATRWEGLTASTLPGMLGLIPETWEPEPVDEQLRAYAERRDLFDEELLRCATSADEKERAWAVRIWASTEAGTEFEPAILAWAARLNGWRKVVQTHDLVEHETETWLRATLDAIVDDRQPGLALAECKLVGHWVAPMWEEEPCSSCGVVWLGNRVKCPHCNGRHESVLANKRMRVPEHVQAQVFYQMAVTGADRVHVVHFWHGTRPRVFTVFRDQDLIDGLMDKGRALWLRVVELRAAAALAAFDARQP